MESKDWSGFGYFSPDFSPGISVYYQLSNEILDYKLNLFRPRHPIKLFPQHDEHLFFSVPGVRDH